MKSIFLPALLAFVVEVSSRPDDPEGPKVCKGNTTKCRWSKEMYKYMARPSERNACNDFYDYSCGLFAETMVLRGSSHLTRDILLSTSMFQDYSEMLKNVRLESDPSAIVRDVVYEYNDCRDKFEKDPKMKEELRASAVNQVKQEIEVFRKWREGENLLVYPFFMTDQQVQIFVKMFDADFVCRKHLERNKTRGIVFDRIYAKKYLKNSKSRYERLVEEVITSSGSAYRLTFNNGSYVKDVSVKVGYPEYLLDDEKLERIARGDSYFKNQVQFASTPAPEPVWERSWHIEHVPTVHWGSNIMYIPGKYLRRAHFNPELPNAVSYGGVGALAAKGIMLNRIKRITREKPTALKNWTSCIADQMTGMKVSTHGKTEGYDKKTRELNEKVALILAASATGLQITYDAWKKNSDHKKMSLPMDNLTPEQLFYVSYAQSWCYQNFRHYMKKFLEHKEPFPFDYHQVNIPVMNDPNFHRAFNCPLESPMHPSKNCFMEATVLSMKK